MFIVSVSPANCSLSNHFSLATLEDKGWATKQVSYAQDPMEAHVVLETCKAAVVDFGGKCLLL
jgi:hypothetical protein